jgi:hypothetical protein
VQLLLEDGQLPKTRLTQAEQRIIPAQAQTVIAAAILRHLHAVITTGKTQDPVVATHGTRHTPQVFGKISGTTWSAVVRLCTGCIDSATVSGNYSDTIWGGPTNGSNPLCQEDGSLFAMPGQGAASLVTADSAVPGEAPNAAAPAGRWRPPPQSGRCGCLLGMDGFDFRSAAGASLWR